MEEQFCVLRPISHEVILVSHGFIAIAMKSTMYVSVNNFMLPYFHAVQKSQEVCRLQVDLMK